MDAASPEIGSGRERSELLYPQLGSVWDEKFEVVSLLGEGGAARVFKARHKVLDRFVALKVIEPSLVSEQSAQRFQNEAIQLGSFSHPNIVGFLSFSSTSSGAPYMVLEFLEGPTLAEILSKEGPLSSEKALALFKEICSGLAYAHERRVLHRDIKPANVIITNTETGSIAKLLDFGLVKALDSPDQGITSTGQILGSANYMSPEQCKGEELDERSDIYSLACLMYETLVGVPPFDDQNDLLIMSRQVKEKRERVPVKGGIPGSLEKIILKGLSKRPADRWSTVSELLQELNKVQFGKAESKKALHVFALIACIAFLGIGIVFLSRQFINQQLTSRSSAPVGKKMSSLAGNESKVVTRWLNGHYNDPDVDPHDLVLKWEQAYNYSSAESNSQLPPHSDEIEKSIDAYVQSHPNDLKLICSFAPMLYRRNKASRAEALLAPLKQRAPGQSEDEYNANLERVYEALFKGVFGPACGWI